MIDRAPEWSHDEDPYQRVLRKTYERRIPFTVHWELTYRCDWSCRHCYADRNGLANELTLDEITDVMNQLAAAGSLFLTFTGGDPLMRKDIREILSEANGRQFALRLMTNGARIDEAMANHLATLNLLGIDISLYAMTPEIHDAITGVSGSHAAVLRGLALCREHGLPLTIKCPLMQLNLKEYRPVADFAAQIGAGFVFDYLLIPTDADHHPMREIGLTDEQMYEFLRDKVSVEGGGRPEPPAPDDPVCGAGSNAVAVNPYGDVYPCLGYREKVGNIREQRFADIWSSPHLDQLHAARYRDYVNCQECAYISCCSRCPGISRAECGRPFDAAPTVCRVAAATKRAVDECLLRAVI
ncbi:MAG: radical SAM protein [Spartobacteria bacterium]|nr:radical SAM protein [Spartobacteria bacterium]